MVVPLFLVYGSPQQDGGLSASGTAYCDAVSDPAGRSFHLDLTLAAGQYKADSATCALGGLTLQGHLTAVDNGDTWFDGSATIRFPSMLDSSAGTIELADANSDGSVTSRISGGAADFCNREGVGSIGIDGDVVFPMRASATASARAEELQAGGLPATPESSVAGTDTTGDYADGSQSPADAAVTAQPTSPVAAPRTGAGIVQGNAFAPWAGDSASPAAADGYACHVRAFTPYSRGNHKIAATARNVCDGPVSYQDLGACLQVIQPNNTFGDTVCAAQHFFGPGTLVQYLDKRCNGTYNWRMRANGHSIVRGVVYGSAENFSATPLLRCL